MKLLHVAMLASLTAAGCTPAPPLDPALTFTPADPNVGIRDTRHVPTFGAYHHRVPVAPRNWRQLNDDLSPASRGGGS